MAQLTQEDLHTALKYHFSYDKFRPFQVEAIQACLSGRDSLLILPTGACNSRADMVMRCAGSAAFSQNHTTATSSPW